MNHFSEERVKSIFPFKNAYLDGCVEKGLEGVEDRKRIYRQKTIANLVGDYGSLYQNHGFGEDEEEILKTLFKF